MKVDLFDFDLPDELIALEPASPREAARLLVVDGAEVEDRAVGDLPTLLRPGDLLVFNDTKVIPAQLEGFRERDIGAEVARTAIGVTLHRRIGEARWHAFVRGARKLRPGDRLTFGAPTAPLRGVAVQRLDDGAWDLEFDLRGEEMITALQRAGEMPLPPYITARRGVREADASDYQTVFARREGAVAAPTAGLHFTKNLLGELRGIGVKSVPVTLHVGAGTFLPVKVDETSDHRMHSEWGEVSEDAVRAVERTHAEGGRVIAVGTTSLRILEAASQGSDGLVPWSGATDIFITPGYRFQSVDLLWTNFHLPRSTLLMLVAAFAGFENILAAYEHAIRRGYRFYSYGDASLLTLDPSARASG